MTQGALDVQGRHWLCGGAALALLLLAAIPAGAQRAKTSHDSLDDLVRVKSEMWLVPQIKDVDALRAEASREETQALSPVFEEWDRFLTEQGGGWKMSMDRLTGRPALLWGKGIPWIPGSANSIRSEEMGLPPSVQGKDVPVGRVAAEAVAFIDAHPGLFGVKSADLRLNAVASGPMQDYLYYLDFDWTYHGIPVERAHVVFRLNHGNLVQMGEEYISPTIVSLDARPYLDSETAWQILWGYVGGQTPEDEIVEPGRLLIVPVSNQPSPGDQALTLGQRMGYRLVYVLIFRRQGVQGTWEARIDAHTGEILAFQDRNDYGSVTGGIYPTSNLDTEVVRPLGFINVSNGTAKTCDAGGNYAYTSGTATAGLTGKYVKVVDSCGTSSLSTSTAPGNLAFGTSTGTDCTTPGSGGAGNTHAARTTYYHLTLWKEKAMAWLPSNTWLQGQLTDNVNLNKTCNAYWNGSSVNFFKSGGGCSNTGELPTVFLHEVGHGLDANDGSPSSTVGSSESYADINALLMTHQSCIGVNFIPGQQCSGYGNPCTSCTGIRDADYALHSHSTSPAVPTQLSGTTGYHCSTSTSYPGPCGYEGHCESYIMSEVGWDLAARDLPSAGYDAATAWFIADRLFFLSRPTSGDAYTCATLATANGCGTSNWYSTYLVADDDNGNLSDGTPHAAAIYAAFNRHAVACSTGSHASYSTCPSLGQSTVSATIADTSVTLTWTPVTNAATYDVYRNESSADAGYAKIATINAPSTSFTDTAVQNGITYYYRVLAVGSTSACFGAMSAAVNATPQPCTPPGAPSITGITDIDACAQSGIAVNYTAGSGATSHNLLKDGTVVVTGYSSGATYNPGDTASHTYVVQAVSGACTTNSAGSAFADASGGPAAPAAPTVTDLDACALTGVQISWGAVTGATGYDLQVDGGTIVSGVTSPYTYSPGDASSHAYAVRAKTASCTGAWSASATGTDSNGLAAPAAPAVADANPCASSGVTITWTAVPSAASYDLQVDGGAIVTGVSSPYLYAPGDANSHGYAVRATNGSCTGAWSASSSGADANATPPAPAAPTFANVTSTSLSVNWSAVPGASAYDLYRQTGGCGAGAVIAPGLTGTTYNDSGLAGGTTYGYYLVAKAGSCASASGTCATVTTVTPPCTTPPTFGGLTSVTAVSGTTCSLQLAWSAGTSNCGGTVTYNVYRDVGSAPVPPAGLIQSGLTGTSYTDTSLTSGTTYTYIVQAMDSVNGLSDGNTIAKSGTPGAPSTSTLFSNGIDNGWSSTQVTGTTGAWTLNTAGTNPTASPHGGTWMVTFNSYTATSGNQTRLYYAPAAFAIPASASSATLSFWMYHDKGYSARNDNIQAQVSTNGTTWNNAGSAVSRYSATNGWTQTTIDVSSYKGSSIYLGFLATGRNGNNMYLDDVALTYNGSTSLDSDGFEVDWYISQVTGTTGTWYIAGSGTNPAAASHAGIAMAEFNSYTANAGDQTRLIWAPGGTLAGFAIPASSSSATLTFWMYHDTQYTNGDTIQAQLSTDGGTTWSNAGPLVNRYDGTSGWAQVSADVTSYAGSTVYIGFLGTSAYGNDMYLDDVLLTATVPGSCTSCSAPSSLTNNTAADVSACAASGVLVSWAQDAGAWGDGGGTRSYDLMMDGAPVQSGIAYPSASTTYTPPDGASHTYAVRYNNACGLSATTAGASAADVNNPAIPTITGGSSNTCPATSVVLTTEAGMNGYQWYLGGSPIGGAASNTYTAAASGSYTVSYTNGSGCSGTSAPLAVTITACAAPEVSPSSDPAKHLAVVKDGSNVDIQFQDVSAAHYNVYVSTSPVTQPFAVTSSATGKKDCGVATTSIAGGMRQVTGYAAESGITTPATVYYILVTADNGAATEGPLGNDSAGTARTADGYCNH